MKPIGLGSSVNITVEINANNVECITTYLSALTPQGNQLQLELQDHFGSTLGYILFSNNVFPKKIIRHECNQIFKIAWNWLPNDPYPPLSGSTTVVFNPSVTFVYNPIVGLLVI